MFHTEPRLLVATQQKETGGSALPPLINSLKASSRSRHCRTKKAHLCEFRSVCVEVNSTFSVSGLLQELGQVLSECLLIGTDFTTMPSLKDVLRERSTNLEGEGFDHVSQLLL